MDFHSLTRRQLQALCKKNKIPANITNLAMADALTALPTVEGIEDLSSNESPGKSLVSSSISVSRTTRRKTTTVKQDESESLHTSTRTRRTETPSSDNGRKASISSSACRKMETQFNEIEEEEEEKENFSETPAIVPASRQRRRKDGTTTLKHAYSTRRSARLAENNNNMSTVKVMKEEEGSQILFSNDSGETLDMNVKEQECPADDAAKEDLIENGEEQDTNQEVAAEDVSQVIDHNDGDDDVVSTENITRLKMSEEEELLLEESNKDMGLLSNNMNDASSSSFEDGKKLNSENEMESEDCPVDDEKDTRQSSEYLLEVLNINYGAVEGSGEYESDLFVPKAAEDITFTTPALEEDIISSVSGKEAFVDGLAEKLIAMELKITTTSAADGEKTCSSSSEDFQVEASIHTDDGGVTYTLKQLSHDELVFDSDLKNDDVLEFEESSSSMKQQEEGANAIDDCPLANCNVKTAAAAAGEGQSPWEKLTEVVVAVPATASILTPMKESPIPMKTASPLKKSVSKKTPSTAVAKRMMTTQVSDDKENHNIGNTGTNLIFGKEEEKKEKKQSHGGEKPLDEQSLRQLLKMLKEKLQISKQININDDNKKAASTARPALQALSENSRLD
ncbi:hypothetical protein ACH5RR_019898 [Cinchona calisaya]|uniref:Uncharacterized protein n=1 Tax=Cinchona calisaya TaxID=153742 RepID=A0ABD2ZRK5_9GENT